MADQVPLESKDENAVMVSDDPVDASMLNKKKRLCRFPVRSAEDTIDVGTPIWLGGLIFRIVSFYFSSLHLYRDVIR